MKEIDNKNETNKKLSNNILKNEPNNILLSYKINKNNNIINDNKILSLHLTTIINNQKKI